MTTASRVVLRTMIFPSSARRFLRSSQPSAYAFSSFQAPSHFSVANTAATVSTQKSGDGNIGSATKFPRPEAIRWQEELSNKVHLIGSISKPVQLKYTETGNAFAWTSLRAKLNAKSSETTWFSLKFQEQMAEIAAEHVKTGDRVYVSGSMNIKEAEDDNFPSTMYQIVVSMLNFVGHDSFFSPQMDVNMNSGSKLFEREKLWLAFFANPTEWWDNRKDKMNPRAPDFRHRSTGQSLWIESCSNPSWVYSKLDKLDESMNFSHELSKTEKSSSLFDDKPFDIF